MRVDDYKNACIIAAQDLAQKDPMLVAKLSGADWLPEEKAFELDFFCRRARITAPDMAVTWKDQKEGEVFSLTDAVLVLHYLLNAKGLPDSGEMVSYRQIPGGEFYIAAFQKRAENPLAKTFGNTEGLLGKAAPAFKGRKLDGYGDEAYAFQVLPHLEIATIVHWGDEEFESRGQVLFDKVIANYLHIEDIAWLGSALVYRLMGAAR